MPVAFDMVLAAIGNIDLDVAHQLASTTYAKKVADKEHLEQNHRINCWTTIVDAVKASDFLTDESEIYRLVDFAQQVILLGQFLDTRKLHGNLTGVFVDKDGRIIKKAPARGEDFVSSLRRC